jgi:hypothetical protein
VSRLRLYLVHISSVKVSPELESSEQAETLSGSHLLSQGESRTREQ